jgi:Amt family ammonium transporter
MITGAIAGLAAVTPASGFVTPAGAIWIGIGAGIFPWLVVTYLKTRFSYDDSLDAFGVHGIGGIWGVIATGIWATKAVNPDGANGLLHGNPMQLWIQIKMVFIVAVFSFIIGAILLKFVDLVMKLRVSEHEERVGLDLTQHREGAYTVIS